jgi:hypothetical protein
VTQFLKRAFCTTGRIVATLRSAYGLLITAIGISTGDKCSGKLISQIETGLKISGNYSITNQANDGGSAKLEDLRGFLIKKRRQIAFLFIWGVKHSEDVSGV